MEQLLIITMILVVVLLVLQIVGLLKQKQGVAMQMEEKDKRDIVNSFSTNVGVISSALNKSVEHLSAEVMANLNNMSQKIYDNAKATDEKFNMIEQKLERKLEQIQQAFDKNMLSMQTSNEAKLSQIQQVVDEKLTNTLNKRFKQSFDILSTQLEKVSETIGEMKSMSAEVGNLTKVLSNVKTTGIFGEIQLGAIIEQILAPEQYETNVRTKQSGNERVEFAIKMPGVGENELLLPIDSKFPYEIYTDMQNAYEENNNERFKEKKKQLLNTLRGMAKDIKEKYIEPPYTTNFAIMFLPVEGLYCEVVKSGLVEEIQGKFQVTVAGPTTMSALLNSLQMGFKTLTIQKKSDEVWKILGGVKHEFEKFGAIIDKIQTKLRGATDELDKLVGVRTRAIQRSLKNVTSLQDGANLIDFMVDDVLITDDDEGEE